MIGPYFMHGCLLVLLSTILYSIKIPGSAIISFINDVEDIEKEKTIIHSKYVNYKQVFHHDIRLTQPING